MHFGPEDRVDAGELFEWENRRLNKYQRDGQQFGQVEVSQRFVAGHDERCDLSDRDAGGLGNERYCSRRTWVDLENEDAVVLDSELDVHEALNPKSSGEKLRIVLDRFEMLGCDSLCGQHTGRVAGVNTSLLDVF